MPNTDLGSLGGSSLLLHPSQSSFDVRIEADVITVLRLIHTNPIDATLKNHLRDLIFAYRQDQTDVKQIELFEAFKPLGITIVRAPKNEPLGSSQHETKKTSVGMARPLPVFKTVSEAQVSKDAKVAPSPDVSPATSVAPNIPESPLNSPLPTENVSELPPSPLKEYAAKNSGPAVAATQTAVAEISVQDRIKEIKQTVNDKVGNPVNLIDANNEVGREYMNALLDAMKKANGGQKDEIGSAMERLEKAFVAVQVVIQQGGGLKEAQKTAQVAAPQVQPDTKNLEVRSVSQTVTRTPAPSVPRTPPVAHQVQATDTAPERKLRQPSVDAVHVVKTHAESAGTQNGAQTAAPADTMRSVAKEKQLQELLRTNREKESKTKEEEEKARIQAMDPLSTPEVTAGLGQLLSEWSLFKSSGIFGTGPSGKEHSLYLKIAPLTMAAVIAGRFEGATPAIKQNITDYMNGWRYEEGIIHEHGETFEHYLRRVIYHILLKKKETKL